MMRFIQGVIFGVLALVLGHSGVASAQELLGDTRAGREFAQTTCAACHRVTPEQILRGNPDAPDFTALAADRAVTDMSLRFLLQRSHLSMPNLILTPKQTDDVIAYILSLRRR